MFVHWYFFVIFLSGVKISIELYYFQKNIHFSPFGGGLHPHQPPFLLFYQGLPQPDTLH